MSSIIKYYDLLGELGNPIITNGVLTGVQLINTGLPLSGYKPLLGVASDGDEIYFKATQASNNAYAVFLGTYNVDTFGNRSITILELLSSYNTIQGNQLCAVSVFNEISLNFKALSSALLTKDSDFSPEPQSSTYSIALTGNVTVNLPALYSDIYNIKYGFLISNKIHGDNELIINASGSNKIVINNTETSQTRASSLGSYIELISTPSGKWYQLISTENLSGGIVGNIGGNAGGLEQAIQFNNNSIASGGKVFWDNNTKSLYIGNTNNISLADTVISASQSKASGIYPFFIRLNQGNFFALTKDGKIGINTPQLPLYESSPHFHMVGRCAVFEGSCGAGGVALTLYNNPDVVPPVGSFGGTINLAARNSNRNVINFGQIQSKVLNPNKGYSSGQLLFNVDVSGLNRNVLSLDPSNISLGAFNALSNNKDLALIGINNSVINTQKTKIIGDNNTVKNSNKLFAIGSSNSIDLVANSVKHLYTYPNTTTFATLDILDDINAQEGDIVEVRNNLTSNGFYVASTGLWTKLDDNTVISYVGTSNIVYGSNDTISGNNLLILGNNSSISGNNISIMGSFNNFKTQTVQDIISSESVSQSIGIGSYNSVDASGLIVFGNHNSASGVKAILLEGSNNILGIGSINSCVIGQNNTVYVDNSIVIGNNNKGTYYFSNLLATNNSGIISSGIGAVSNSSVSGNTISIVGQNIDSLGGSDNLIGYQLTNRGNNNNILGNSIYSSGNYNSFIGNNIAYSGTMSNIIGNNIVSNGVSSSSIIIGSNIASSGGIEDSSVIGSNTRLTNGNFSYADVFGDKNIISSGIDNVILLGARNTSTNTFNFDVPYTTFSTAVSGTILTSNNIDDFSKFRINDIISLINGTSVTPETTFSTFIISNIYRNKDDTGKFTGFSIEQSESISQIQPIILAKSVTYQNEQIFNLSNPNIIVGNKNTTIGISGTVVGNNNTLYGSNIKLFSHNASISGNNIVSISDTIAASGVSNLTSIGRSNTGFMDSSNIIGSNNLIIGSGLAVLGNRNIAIKEDINILGQNNILSSIKSNIAGNYNYIASAGTTIGDPSIGFDDNGNRVFSNSNFINQILVSGTYIADTDTITIDATYRNQFDVAFYNEYYVLVALKDGDFYTKPYIGKLSDGVQPAIGESISISFRTFKYDPCPDCSILNPLTFKDHLRLLNSDKSFDKSSVIIGIINANNTVYGNYNKIIAPSGSNSVIGNNNQIGLDWASYGSNAIKLPMAARSGLIIGSNNSVYSNLQYSYDFRGNLVDISRASSNENIFQGAIGLGIVNNEHNAIKFGYSNVTFKVFGLGGVGDTDIQEMISAGGDGVPPTFITKQAENIGGMRLVQGTLFNSDYINNSFIVANNSKSKAPVLSVISTGTGFVGINSTLPTANLDIVGDAKVSQTLTSQKIITNTITIPSGAGRNYFLSSINDKGDTEWVPGIKVDVNSKLPNCLVYFSGTVDANGKLLPINSVDKAGDGSDYDVNRIFYEPSGCTISSSGLLFNQFLWSDKYAIMTLDEHRRNTLSYAIEKIQANLLLNPKKYDYIKRLQDLAKTKGIIQSDRFIPRTYSALYFIPEASQYYNIDPDVKNIGGEYYSTLSEGLAANQALFVIGRRDTEYSKPVDFDKGEDPSNEFFPGGLKAPQTIISNIPKKEISGTTWKPPGYKFGYNEMIQPHLAPTTAGSPAPGDVLYRHFQPLVDTSDENNTYNGWWHYDVEANTGRRPLENGSTVDRSVPTAFNMGLQDIDFVIYGTGSKYKDKPAKFLFGGYGAYKEWAFAGLAQDQLKLPCLTKIPAFYFNASINSFMINTDRPSWLPIKLPRDEKCDPCGPIQSGILFADMTFRGFIATSGFRLGQGIRQAQTTDQNGKLALAFTAKGEPIWESTEGMYLTSDRYGMAQWSPLGGASSSNNLLLAAPNATVPTESETLTEGSLDPLFDYTQIPLESTEVETARLFRETLGEESQVQNPSMRLRGVTKNTLLFAKNPVPNRENNTRQRLFNESATPSIGTENNVDGTENLFYYGYTNALAASLYYNTCAETTELIIEGDATKRIKLGDIVRIYYRYLDTNDNQLNFVEKASVAGIHLFTRDKVSDNGRKINSRIILDKKLTNVQQATYDLAPTNILRQAAIISETVGGYLTFNFPGSKPDLVLSNRPGIYNQFNATGKRIGFSVYGPKPTALDLPKTVFNVDHVLGLATFGTNRPFEYGSYPVKLNIDSNAERNINSDLYYDYGWYDDYVLGVFDTDETVIKTVDISRKFIVGDIVEVIYNISQVTNAIVTKVETASSEQKITLSYKQINLSLVDDKLVNYNNTNKNIRFKTIKKMLMRSGDSAIGAKPLFAGLSVRGLLYSDAIMIGPGDTQNGHSVRPGSVIYSQQGVLGGSKTLNIRPYTDIYGQKNECLTSGTDTPEPIGVTPSGAIVADITLNNNVKIKNLYIDQIVDFNTIDCGVVIFGGICQNSELVCK